jgi:hypothetical protein
LGWLKKKRPAKNYTAFFSTLMSGDRRSLIENFNSMCIDFFSAIVFAIETLRPLPQAALERLE